MDDRLFDANLLLGWSASLNHERKTFADYCDSLEPPEPEAAEESDA